ncbi:MAG: hypothetical protein IKD69_09420 [Solobacterium sp.]|nr:hypothetical protein [Solobacterium sp.]
MRRNTAVFVAKNTVRELLDAQLKAGVITEEAAKEFARFRVSKQTLAGKPKADNLFVPDQMYA